MRNSHLSEIGGSYRSGNVAIKGSYYNTQWKDRNLTRNVETVLVTQIQTSFILLV